MYPQIYWLDHYYGKSHLLLVSSPFALVKPQVLKQLLDLNVHRLKQMAFRDIYMFVCELWLCNVV